MEKTEETTSNAEKVWTILKIFPDGITAKALGQRTGLSRTTLYETLGSLRGDGRASNRNRKWYPITAESKKPLGKPSRNLILPSIIGVLAFFLFGIFYVAQQDRSLKLLNDTILNPAFGTSIYVTLLPIGALAGYAIIRGLCEKRARA